MRIRSMKKCLLLSAAAVTCILLAAGLAACGGEQNEGEQNESADNTEATAETTAKAEDTLSPERLNEEMIGVWVPAKGVENDTVSFGYLTDSDYTDDPSGQLCIHVDYALGDGGGASAAEYEVRDGKLVYTTFESSYSAGGEIDDTWTIDAGALPEDKAVINGVAYEKATDDPSDQEQRAKEIIDSRIIPLLAGEWEGFDGMVYFKLNKDGTMHYEDSSMGVDGTWEYEGGMMVRLDFTDPYNNEKESDYYRYEVGEDYLEGQDINQGRFDRK